MATETRSDEEGAGLRARLQAWAEQSGCRLCVLFGSRAGGGPIVSGDVDIALQFDALPEPERRLAIIGELQDIVGRADVDVVFLHLRTDPVLRFEVFRTGQVVHEAREGLFVDEKVRALMLYEDALPFRRMLREHLAGAGDVT